jgi:hypothetical protein
MFDWLRKKAAAHEGEAIGKEYPVLKNLVTTHKEVAGDILIALTAMGLLLAQLDPHSRYALPLALATLFVGGILKSAGAFPSDAEQRAKTLEGKLLPAALEIRDHTPELLEAVNAVSEILRPHLEANTAAMKDLHGAVVEAAAKPSSVVSAPITVTASPGTEAGAVAAAVQKAVSAGVGGTSADLTGSR